MQQTRMIPISSTLAGTVVSLFLVSAHVPQQNLSTMKWGQNNWKPSLHKDDIYVEVSQEEGQKLKAFRAITTVQAPLANVLAVLQDLKNRKDWLKNSAETQIIERIGATNYILYERTHLSLISDRDSVIAVTTHANPSEKRAEILFHSTTHKNAPEKEGIVRMPEVKGHFYLYPEQQGNATRIEYQAYADPGGSLPAFLVNWAAKTVPYDTLMALKKQVQKPQRQEDIAFITNLPGYQEVMKSAENNSLLGKSTRQDR